MDDIAKLPTDAVSELTDLLLGVKVSFKLTRDVALEGMPPLDLEAFIGHAQTAISCLRSSRKTLDWDLVAQFSPRTLATVQILAAFEDLWEERNSLRDQLLALRSESEALRRDKERLEAELRDFQFVRTVSRQHDETPAIPRDKWHDDEGTVLWWYEDHGEPPYVGSPLMDDWDEDDGYTHFTRIANPVFPRSPVVIEGTP